jgi:hypothetical protein
MLAIDADDFLVAGVDGQDVIVGSTTDGGVSWTTFRIEPGIQPGAVTLAADADTDVVLVQETTGANFSSAIVYVGNAARSEWDRHDAPAAGELTLDSAGRLWLTGGVQHQQVWISEDLGQTWHEVGLPSIGKSFTLAQPATLPDGTTLIGVTLNGPETAELYLKSSDAGRTWQQVGRIDDLGPTEAGIALASAVVDSKHWMVTTPAADQVLATASAGQDFSRVSATGLRPGIVAMSFATSSQGWAVTASGTCGGNKADCTFDQSLFATNDGGRTWRQLAVPD